VSDADGKRYTKRARKRLLVKFGLTAADKTAFTKNISETGLFIHTNSIIKPGTTILVQIQFPDRTFSHWARVAWGKQVPTQLSHVLDCGMGVTFIDPGPEWSEFFAKWKKGTGG
jgi:Tfp pilus assembly protein PilZ